MQKLRTVTNYNKNVFEWINVDGSEYAFVLIEVNFNVNGLKIAFPT